MGAVLFASVACGGTTTFTGSVNNNWNHAGNWNNGVPTHQDRAIIPASLLCEVDITTAEADTVQIAYGGTLKILNGKKLTLDNDDDNLPDNSVVNGTLLIQGGSSTAGTLSFVQQSHVVSGTGKIEGEKTICVVEIDAGKRLTNQLTAAGVYTGIIGSMTIKSTSPPSATEFRNEGILRAEGVETMVLETTCVLSDHSISAVWEANFGGTLQFKRDATSLLGTIKVWCVSTLDFQASVQTCGEFQWNSGACSVVNGETFRYVSYSSDAATANPGDDICPGRCDCQKWEITGPDSGDIACTE